jgi:four helix bundle protein
MPIVAQHRLDAFHAALDLARRIPRGHRPLADQLSRADNAVPLLVAEGAHRAFAGHKRFAEARGECGEVAAVAEVLEVLALVRIEDTLSVLDSARRLTSMLNVGSSFEGRVGWFRRSSVALPVDGVLISRAATAGRGPGL